MNIADYINKLKAEIEKGLPGENAQYQMAPTGRKPSKEYLASSPSHPRKSGVALLLYPAGSSLCSILTLRPSYEGIHSGQVSLPGGKKDQTDSSLCETALRELREETGMDTKAIQVLGELTQLYIPVSNALVYPFVFFSKEKPAFSPHPEEVKEIIEFEIDRLNDPRVKKNKSIQLSKGISIQSPYYDIEGHTVWGATAMILSEFERILENLATSS